MAITEATLKTLLSLSIHCSFNDPSIGRHALFDLTPAHTSLQITNVPPDFVLTGQYKVVRADEGLLQGEWTYVLTYNSKGEGEMTFVSSGAPGTQIITFDLPKPFGERLANAHLIAAVPGMGTPETLEGVCSLK